MTGCGAEAGTFFITSLLDGRAERGGISCVCSRKEAAKLAAPGKCVLAARCCMCVYCLCLCCSKICRRWEVELSGGKDHFRPVTGLPISTYFSAYKFQWLAEHVPEVRPGQREGGGVTVSIGWWIHCQYWLFSLMFLHWFNRQFCAVRGPPGNYVGTN